MSPATRGLIRITLPPEYEGRAAVKDLVDRLMGRNPAPLHVHPEPRGRDRSRTDRRLMVQEEHAAACEKLGPSRCRITGMRYDLVRGGDITGSLSVSLDRNIARAFGKDGIAAASKLGGKLTSASIDGQDMAAQIAAAKGSSTSSANRIADLEKQLARTDLGDRERAELREQLEMVRSSRDESRGSVTMAEAQVALTPMTMRYDGSGTMALSDNPLTSAGGAFVASATSVLSLLLFGLAYGLPWIALALAAVALWRTSWARKLRAFVSPVKPEA
jgi:hypothetical protein